MPDFIAALRERTGHVEEAHELGQRRQPETPSLPTVYQRRRDCAQFRGEWPTLMQTRLPFELRRVMTGPIWCGTRGEDTGVHH